MSFKFEGSFTGDNEVGLALLRMKEYARNNMRRAVKEIAEDKLEISRERVPKDEGDLAESGRVGVRVGEKQVTAAIRYGNDDVDYAVTQHEDLTLNHPNGGQAKYVESVLNETDLGAEVLTALALEAAG